MRKAVTLLIFYLGVSFYEQVDGARDQWIKLKDRPYVPDSPFNVATDALDFISKKKKIGSQDGPKTEDLSVNLSPQYCRCAIRLYCPEEFTARASRVLNKPSCPEGSVMCCQPSGIACGLVAPFPHLPTNPMYGEANYAEYPWTALIVDARDNYHKLGIIIAPNAVLTTVKDLDKIEKPMKVRLGEWDLSTPSEPFLAREYRVDDYVVHPDYNPSTLQNDVAILRLKNVVSLGAYPSIRSACLGTPGDPNKYTNSKCIMAGWGQRVGQNSEEESPKERNLLKEVALKIIDPVSCQTQIRKSIDNSEYALDYTTFLCAGGEKGRGPCPGDEGGALVCRDTPESPFMVVGMSSWGNSCGQEGFPGVFTNMTTYYSWIKGFVPYVGQ